MVAKKYRHVHTDMHSHISYIRRYTNNIYIHTNVYVEAIELHEMADTISFTRQMQTKLNFKLLHALDPQNTGQVETKALLTFISCTNLPMFTSNERK